MERHEKQKKRKIPSTATAVGLGVLVAAGMFGALWFSHFAWISQEAVNQPQIATGVNLPEGQTELYVPGESPDRFVYQGTFLEPVGEPLDMPDSQMAVVGNTEDGYLMYGYFPDGVTMDQPDWPVGGGGGAGPDSVPQAEGDVYLRTPAGQYVLLTEAGTRRGVNTRTIERE